jgi:ribosomal-protein-serine acetyltransferase
MRERPFYLTIDSEIELRVLEEKDARVFYRLIEQNRNYLREWLPWVDSTRSVEDEQAFIRTTYENYLDNKALTCGVWYRGQAAGTIGFHLIDWVGRQVEIGYWLAASFQGKGLMTRACKAMVDYAFHSLNLNRVVIRCATGNRRSCAIPQRLGFTQEGVLRQAEWLSDHFVDLIVYSMLVSEWAEHNRK